MKVRVRVQGHVVAVCYAIRDHMAAIALLRGINKRIRAGNEYWGKSTDEEEFAGGCGSGWDGRDCNDSTGNGGVVVSLSK